MERTPQTPLTKSVSNKSPERPSVVSDPRYARGISPRAQQRAVVVQRRHLLRWKRRAQHCALLRARSLAAAHATVGVRIWFALYWSFDVVLALWRTHPRIVAARWRRAVGRRPMLRPLLLSWLRRAQAAKRRAIASDIVAEGFINHERALCLDRWRRAIARMGAAERARRADESAWRLRAARGLRALQRWAIEQRCHQGYAEAMAAYALVTALHRWAFAAASAGAWATADGAAAAALARSKRQRHLHWLRSQAEAYRAAELADAQCDALATFFASRNGLRQAVYTWRFRLRRGCVSGVGMAERPMQTARLDELQAMRARGVRHEERRVLVFTLQLWLRAAAAYRALRVWSRLGQRREGAARRDALLTWLRHATECGHSARLRGYALTAWRGRAQHSALTAWRRSSHSQRRIHSALTAWRRSSLVRKLATWRGHARGGSWPARVVAAMWRRRRRLAFAAWHAVWRARKLQWAREPVLAVVVAYAVKLRGRRALLRWVSAFVERRQACRRQAVLFDAAQCFHAIARQRHRLRYWRRIHARQMRTWMVPLPVWLRGGGAEHVAEAARMAEAAPAVLSEGDGGGANGDTRTWDEGDEEEERRERNELVAAMEAAAVLVAPADVLIRQDVLVAVEGSPHGSADGTTDGSATDGTPRTLLHAEPPSSSLLQTVAPLPGTSASTRIPTAHPDTSPHQARTQGFNAVVVPPPVDMYSPQTLPRSRLEALERAHVHRLKSGLDGRRALRAWRAAAAAIGAGRHRAAALKRVADVFGAIGGVGARVRLQRSIIVWQAESHAILLMRAAGSQSAKWGNRACSAAALRLWRRALWQLRLGSLAHAHALGWHAPYAPPLQLAHSSRYVGLARALRPWRDACARTRAFTAALERADSPRYVRLARALYTWWDACACTRALRSTAERFEAATHPSPWYCSLRIRFLNAVRLAAALRRPTLGGVVALWTKGRLTVDTLAYVRTARPALQRAWGVWARWASLEVRAARHRAAKEAGALRRTLLSWVGAWVDAALMHAAAKSTAWSYRKRTLCARAVQRWVASCALAVLTRTHALAEEAWRRQRAWLQWLIQTQEGTAARLGASIGGAAGILGRLQLALRRWEDGWRAQVAAAAVQATLAKWWGGVGLGVATRAARRLLSQLRIGTLAGVLGSVACARGDARRRRLAWAAWLAAGLQGVWLTHMMRTAKRRALGDVMRRWCLVYSPDAPPELIPISPVAWMGARATLMFAAVGRAFKSLVAAAEVGRREAAERARGSLCRLREAMVLWRESGESLATDAAAVAARARQADRVRLCRAVHTWDEVLAQYELMLTSRRILAARRLAVTLRAWPDGCAAADAALQARARSLLHGLLKRHVYLWQRHLARSQVAKRIMLEGEACAMAFALPRIALRHWARRAERWRDEAAHRRRLVRQCRLTRTGRRAWVKWVKKLQSDLALRLVHRPPLLASLLRWRISHHRRASRAYDADVAAAAAARVCAAAARRRGWRAWRRWEASDATGQWRARWQYGARVAASLTHRRLGAALAAWRHWHARGVWGLLAASAATTHVAFSALCRALRERWQPLAAEGLHRWLLHRRAVAAAERASLIGALRAWLFAAAEARGWRGAAEAARVWRGAAEALAAREAWAMAETPAISEESPRVAAAPPAGTARGRELIDEAARAAGRLRAERVAAQAAARSRSVQPKVEQRALPNARVQPWAQPWAWTLRAPLAELPPPTEESIGGTKGELACIVAAGSAAASHRGMPGRRSAGWSTAPRAAPPAPQLLASRYAEVVRAGWQIAEAVETRQQKAKTQQHQQVQLQAPRAGMAHAKRSSRVVRWRDEE